jgi:hypothetical protein
MHVSKDSMWRGIWKILQNFLGTKLGLKQNSNVQSNYCLISICDRTSCAKITLRNHSRVQRIGWWTGGPQQSCPLGHHLFGIPLTNWTQAARPLPTAPPHGSSCSVDQFPWTSSLDSREKKPSMLPWPVAHVRTCGGGRHSSCCSSSEQRDSIELAHGPPFFFCVDS